MANPYVNKVQKADGTTLIDLTADTAVAADVASGKYFHLATGERVAGTASGSRLPSGYTEVEYIHPYGSAGCYINTGYTPVSNTRVECVFRLSSVSSSNSPVFGVAGQFTFRKYNASTFRTNGSNNVDFATVTPDTNKHTVIKTPTGTILDGECKATNAATISYPLYICGYNSGTSNSQAGWGDIYSFKIYEGNTLKRDYVPCKNTANVAGLYDLVNGTFNKSSGSSSFTAGPAV